jgi:phenylalanyl-tRNA synthetase beta chain
MKISYHWLKQYINFTETPEKIAQVLTATGLEVESIVPFETVKGGLNGLVIGEVLTCIKHPNADKLSVTTVDVGAQQPLHIVCGAPNVATGQKVVVAIPGTTIHPVKGEPFVIKTTKIRGELSEGMICAEDEIGLGEGHVGIIILDDQTQKGASVAAYYNLQTDYVLEIGLTPNRADAASHIGVARDIKAAQNLILTWPSVEEFKVNHNFPISVTVENTEACPRYSGVTLTGVTVRESPDWLKSRLRSIGLTPINNIVDISNYVLHETGQPLHAFDADQITGRQVIVKTLPAGTKFQTLDGKERTLTASDLMICNTEEGMCLAGIFGGLKSGVSAKTKNLFLESACFSPAYIRKSGMHHQLKTDASFRFERGTDPNNTVYALKRAALLIQEIAGGQVSSDVVDIYPHKIPNRKIIIKDRNVARLIGKEIPRERIFSILESLDIKIIDSTDNNFSVDVPPYRVDVVQEADVVEEILRIYGFNNIELAEAAGAGYLADFPGKDVNKFKRNLGEILSSNGFYEILTNSLTNKAYQQSQHISFRGGAIEILNKLSEQQGILRQTMLFTGLEVCAYNINRRQKDLKLFEFGKIYWKDSGPSAPGAKSSNPLAHYHEEDQLALYLTGNFENENWQNKTRAVNYFDVAQAIANILQKCNIKNFKQEKLNDPLFEYGMKIIQGHAEIGKLGKIKSSFGKDFGIRQEIFYAELSMALLFKLANPKFEVQEVAKFPEVRRDLSLVLDKAVTFGEIYELVLVTEKRLIKEIKAFDVYQGDTIPEGKKAYALGFTLQDETKTLTDPEIDRTMAKLMGAFEQKMGALIRK